MGRSFCVLSHLLSVLPIIEQDCTLLLKTYKETVGFYLDIAEKTNNQQIKEYFRRASADEQNHAVWHEQLY
ncbi:ferritin family protein [Paenibacillus sp. yr247]|uniref:ferritin family protein n=1 Tax=Paenibacillus sp. yr247 TaxID=1761880 RepID=UPI001140487F|nr:ferritin family protein [Paenibacillus sp. yr247]